MSRVVLATHINGEREKITIERVTGGKFKGDTLLVIHDDPPPRGSGVAAPMLLDEGTSRWLAEQLEMANTDLYRGTE